MPNLKATEPKVCAWCSTLFDRKRYPNGRLEDYGVFQRRRFCSLSCGTSWQHASTTAPTDAASRKRAMRFTGERCDSCGFSGDLTIHHCDGDPKNNQPENLQTLCRSCHSFWHALLKRIGRTQSERMPRLVARDGCGVTAMPSSRKSRKPS